MTLSHPFKVDRLRTLPLSMPLSSRSSKVWCPWLCQFVPACSVSSSLTIQIFQDASHLWGLLCPPAYLLGHFPSLWHVQDSTPTGFSRVDVEHWHISVWASHSTFCSKLIESVWMMAAWWIFTGYFHFWDWYLVESWKAGVWCLQKDPSGVWGQRPLVGARGQWVTSLRFNEIKNEEKCLCWFLIDFIFCRMAETAVSGSPSVTWLSRKLSGESVRLPS